MKMFFFSNKGWGECYTVMAKSVVEARNVLLNHLDKQRDAEIEETRSIFSEQPKDKFKQLMDQVVEEWDEKLSIDKVFDIKVYDVGEVLTTEYD